MEQGQTRREWLHGSRKIVAVIVLLIVVPQIVVYAVNVVSWINLENNPELDPFYEPEYNLTVWIAPEEEEFILHVDFYDSEQDALSKVNRHDGIGIRVAPSDNVKNNLNLFTVPENRLSLWVKIYFDQHTEEPNIIVRVEMGIKVTTHLLAREISILVEPMAQDGV